MKRFIESALIDWKSSPRRKPLILRGARQVGKTYSLKHFGKEYFGENVVFVDLEKHPEWQALFTKNLDAKRILSELEWVLHHKITPGETLLIFDEIQTCPAALRALRYFYEEIADLHVIAAGSLLEFALSEISFPVGRVQFLEMGPLNFIEFLLAVHKPQLAELVLQGPQNGHTLGDVVHQELLAETRKYFFVGGMPEAVAVFSASQSFRDSFAVHAELVAAFRDDFAKYSPRMDSHCLELVFRAVAKNLGQQLKYARLAEGYSQPTLKKAFDLLCQARLLYKVESASPAGIPLGASANPKIFKALLLDIGLVHHLCGLSAETEWLSQDLLAIYEGALAEQFVGQEILSALGRELHYWSRSAKNSSAEVDFLFTKKSEICPVEVKSGPEGRLRSLHLLLKTYPHCQNGTVFSTALPSVIKEKRLVFLPLYYAFSFAHPAENPI